MTKSVGVYCIPTTTKTIKTKSRAKDASREPRHKLTMDKKIILFIIFRVLYLVGFVPIYFAADILWHNDYAYGTPTDCAIFLGVAFVYIIAVRFCEMHICENPKN